MKNKTIPLSAESIELASKIVREGGLIVFPTDTVYGLGADPFNGEAVERLFKAKGREAKPIPILCDSEKSARKLAALDDLSLRLAKAYWPGPLTIVVPLRRGVPSAVHQGTFTAGVRVPASDLCLRLIEKCGGYLTGTSANRSGRPPARSAQEAYAELGEKVDLILDGGMLGGKESTVVRVSHNRVQVLRKGSVRVSDAIKSD